MKTVFMVLAVLCVAAVFFARVRQTQKHTSAFFCMSTIVNQTVYGPKASAAMQEVEQAFVQYETTLSLFHTQSDITNINANAGKGAVKVSEATIALLQQAKQLSQQSENAFALTIAPLTSAWGVTTGAPRVVPPAERQALLALVNDEDIVIDAAKQTVQLLQAGQAIDLGGIAKGAACNLAAQIYQKHGVKSALLNLGGNVFAFGTRPDKTPFRIGFRDPSGAADTAIASFEMQNNVFAVSGAYERFFEENGVRYHHILDLKTGAPAQSDIVSVGVMHNDGAVADFYSTTLFVWGVEKTLKYMRAGGTVVMLDKDNHIYVSKSLQQSFQLFSGISGYKVIYI